MAATTRNATSVSNFEASPAKMNNQQHVGAKTHIFEGTVELAAADASGAILGMLWMHKTWSVKDIRIKCDVVNSVNDADLGLYSSPSDNHVSSDLNAADTDGDHDAYAAALDLSSAIAIWTGVDKRDAASVHKQVFEDAGETDIDASKEWYLLALTMNTDPAAADTVSWQVFVTMPGGA